MLFRVFESLNMECWWLILAESAHHCYGKWQKPVLMYGNWGSHMHLEYIIKEVNLVAHTHAECGHIMSSLTGWPEPSRTWDAISLKNPLLVVFWLLGINLCCCRGICSMMHTGTESGMHGQVCMAGKLKMQPLKLFQWLIATVTNSESTCSTSSIDPLSRARMHNAGLAHPCDLWDCQI
jgi:hypothetical protein